MNEYNIQISLFEWNYWNKRFHDILIIWPAPVYYLHFRTLHKSIHLIFFKTFACKISQSSALIFFKKKKKACHLHPFLSLPLFFN